jgi:hypothetical protein
MNNKLMYLKDKLHKNNNKNTLRNALQKETIMTKDIKFVFEDIVEFRNLISCEDKNMSGIGRFTTSPVVSTMIRHCNNKLVLENIDYTRIGWIEFATDMQLENYIIASGVAHAPYDWCGPCDNSMGLDHRFPDKKNLFHFLNDVYLKDLRKNNAYLLLDQTHEGYQDYWLFDWFHISCETYNISPSRIIYVTGNLTVHEQYSKWCEDKNITDRMIVIPEAHFEHCIFVTMVNRVKIEDKPELPSFNNNIEYKEKNLNNIKLYNLLQKRPRAHRVWMFKEIVENGLLQLGINTMNSFERNNTYYFGKEISECEYNELNKLLPMLPFSNESYEKELQEFSDMSSGKYVMEFNEDILLNSWVSVISEAFFAEETCFISEKTFKVIAAGHPFIIFGNKHSLKALHDKGYKTFDPFIDESYDEQDTWERLNSIIKCIKDLSEKSNAELIEWYKSIQDIIDHNKNILKINSIILPPNAVSTIFTSIKCTDHK